MAKEHHHREQKQHFHVGSPDQSSLMGKVEVTLLARFYLLHSFRKLFRQRDSHQDQTIIANWSTAENVVGLLPGKRSRGLRFHLLQRNLGS